MLVSCLTSSGGQLVGVAVTEICVLVPPPVEPCVHAPEFCIDSCDVQVACSKATEGKEAHPCISKSMEGAGAAGWRAGHWLLLAAQS